MTLDLNLLLRNGSTAGNLTANELTPASKDFGAGQVHDETYEVIVPLDSAGDTLDIVIQDSVDDSVWTNFLVFPQITGKGVYRRTGRSPKRYRRYTATVGGAAINFGAVTIGLVPGGEYTSF